MQPPLAALQGLAPLAAPLPAPGPFQQQLYQQQQLFSHLQQQQQQKLRAFTFDATSAPAAFPLPVLPPPARAAAHSLPSSLSALSYMAAAGAAPLHSQPSGGSSPGGTYYGPGFFPPMAAQPTFLPLLSRAGLGGGAGSVAAVSVAPGSSVGHSPPSSPGSGGCPSPSPSTYSFPTRSRGPSFFALSSAHSLNSSGAASLAAGGGAVSVVAAAAAAVTAGAAPAPTSPLQRSRQNSLQPPSPGLSALPPGFSLRSNFGAQQ